MIRKRCIRMARAGWGFAVLMISLARLAGGAELKVVSADLYLFGGREKEVTVAIENAGKENIEARLEYRLFQASSGTLAPSGENVTLGAVRFAGEERKGIQVVLTPPEVRTITAFKLKIYEGGTELDGAIALTVCPARMFTRLNELAGPVAVTEKGEKLVETLKAGGAVLAEDNDETKLRIVALTGKEGEGEWTGSAGKEALMFIVGAGVTGSEKLVPLKFTLGPNGRRVGILQEWFVPQLEEDALSQLRLLRAVELLLEPEKTKTPAVEKRK